MELFTRANGWFSGPLWNRSVARRKGRVCASRAALLSPKRGGRKDQNGSKKGRAVSAKVSRIAIWAQRFYLQLGGLSG